MLGYASFDELAAMNLEPHEYHPKYSRRGFKERIERDGEIKGVEGLRKKADGTFAYIRENAKAIRDDNGNTLFYEGTVEDLTHQKEAQRKIHTLSQQLLRAQESERQMISRELHDRIAQDLAAAKIGCDTLFDNSSEYSPLLHEKTARISETLQYSINSVRDLAYDLRPPGLDQVGFVETVSDYCEEFSEKTGIEIELSSVDMDHRQLDSNTQINLYRLVQEGFNNVRKHANAGRMTVGLVGSSQKIILTVEDDGRGFDVEERMASMDHEKRMGLRSMEERTRLLGGRFDIRSAPGKGTSIMIEIPFLDRGNG
jgi:PAS domain S-box-containing protein